MKNSVTPSMDSKRCIIFVTLQIDFCKYLVNVQDFYEVKTVIYISSVYELGTVYSYIQLQVVYQYTIE